MCTAPRRLAAAGLLLLAAISGGTTARAADKVRCAAAYEQGQELRRQDKLAAARSELLICEQTCPKALAADCTRWQAEVEALMPTVHLRARDAQGRALDARVLVDDTLLLEHLVETPVPVDAGDHTFRFEGPAGVTAEVRVSLHGGERERAIEAVLAPPEVAAPAPVRSIAPAAYVTGAAGAAGLALGAALSIVGHLDAGHLHSTCAPGCAPDRVSAIATLYDVAWASAGVGVASLAVALVLWAPWAAASAPQAGLGPFVVPTAGGAVAGWTFR
jgi:hypothetical protein